MKKFLLIAFALAAGTVSAWACVNSSFFAPPTECGMPHPELELPFMRAV